VNSDKDFHLWNLFRNFENDLVKIKYLPFLASFRNIFEDIYNQSFLHKTISKRKYLRFSDFESFLNHLLWFFLWSFKYVLFLIFNKKNLVLISVGSDRNTSFSYAEYLSSWSKNNNSNILSLNILCKSKYLFSKNIFYYPKSAKCFSNKLVHFLRNSHNEQINIISKKQNYWSYKASKRTVKTINYNSREMLSFLYLIRKHRTRILFLVQDFDYTDNKYIFCNIAKIFHIPTFTLDHSILPYRYMYSNSYSDFALVWGNYQKERINNNYGKKPKQIFVSGKPNVIFGRIITNKSKKYWTYIPIAYSNPGVISFTRNANLLFHNVYSIKTILNKYFSNMKLILKIHPQDNKNSFVFLKKIATISKILIPYVTEAQILFVEDSSFSIELLQYDIPIIYLPDDKNNDPFKIKDFTSIYFLDKGKPFLDLILEAINNKIDWSKRQKHFEYFFNDSTDYESTLHNILNNAGKQSD